jgi:plasmid replication DNA-binding protein KfrA
MIETSKVPKPPSPPRRGVTASDVEHAADALLRTGERPTIARIRAKLGTGSPNTINPLLDGWWKRLGRRLDAGPAALHRLPEAVAMAAEALWLQALAESRRRAAQEQQSTTRVLANDKQQLDVRSHVLSLREGELESRLALREREHALLESHLQQLTTLLRKEQAVRESQARRISVLEAEIEAQLRRRIKPRLPPAAPIADRKRARRRDSKTESHARARVPRISTNKKSARQRRRRV